MKLFSERCSLDSIFVVHGNASFRNVGLNHFSIGGWVLFFYKNKSGALATLGHHRFANPYCF